VSTIDAPAAAASASAREGVSINHHRQGTGPPLVLLHGIGHHWQAWRPVISLLSQDFEILACDSPGFGRSDPLASGVEPTIGAYVDAFERFFSELGLERPHVAGNSMGGAIALELARRRTVSSATAFSPAGFWTSAERRFCQRSLGALAAMPRVARPAVTALARTRAGRVALFAQLFGRPTRMPAEEAVATLTDAWAAPAFTAALAAFDEYDFNAPEGIDDLPVTVAWGASDHLLPYRRQAPRARARLPRARHLTLGTGHVPYFDDPPAVAEAIRSTAEARGAA
jgi:pimeloyl-ACP methyl ester carboxylesterase